MEEKRYSLYVIDFGPAVRAVLGILLDSFLTVWLQSGVVQK